MSDTNPNHGDRAMKPLWKELAIGVLIGLTLMAALSLLNVPPFDWRQP